MDGNRLELRYQRGDATADDIQVVADELLADLGDPTTEAAREALAGGLNLDSVGGTVIEVREAAQGAEPVLAAILIGISVSAGSTVAESIWRDLLWPRIKRRLGAGALGPRQAAAGGGP